MESNSVTQDYKEILFNISKYHEVSYLTFLIIDYCVNYRTQFWTMYVQWMEIPATLERSDMSLQAVSAGKSTVEQIR